MIDVDDSDMDQALQLRQSNAGVLLKFLAFAIRNMGKASAFESMNEPVVVHKRVQLGACQASCSNSGSPASFTPCSVNTFLARSIPTVRMAMTFESSGT